MRNWNSRSGRISGARSGLRGETLAVGESADNSNRACCAWELAGNSMIEGNRPNNGYSDLYMPARLRKEYEKTRIIVAFLCSAKIDVRCQCSDFPGTTAMNAAIHLTYKVARRIAVIVVGGTILLLGIIMLVTPGPGLVVIPVGLAILGLEFAWARLWLKKVRRGISKQMAKQRATGSERWRPDGIPVRAGKERSRRN